METFVVRVWEPAPAEERTREMRSVHGLVEHVASGRSSAFRGLDELAALILTTVAPGADAGTDEPKWHEDPDAIARVGRRAGGPRG
jgi:hypothetical protein